MFAVGQKNDSRRLNAHDQVILGRILTCASRKQGSRQLVK